MQGKNVKAIICLMLLMNGNLFEFSQNAIVIFLIVPIGLDSSLKLASWRM